VGCYEQGLAEAQQSPKRSVHVFTFPYLREHADARGRLVISNFAGHNSVDASRRCADDPTTLLNLIARRMGQGLLVVHRAAVAHVEAAFATGGSYEAVGNLSRKMLRTVCGLQKLQRMSPYIFGTSEWKQRGWL